MVITMVGVAVQGEEEEEVGWKVMPVGEVVGMVAQEEVGQVQVVEAEAVEGV